jgi:hypothetical protein
MKRENLSEIKKICPENIEDQLKYKGGDFNFTTARE